MPKAGRHVKAVYNADEYSIYLHIVMSQDLNHSGPALPHRRTPRRNVGRPKRVSCRRATCRSDTVFMVAFSTILLSSDWPPEKKSDWKGKGMRETAGARNIFDRGNLTKTRRQSV